jgi:hypothetical protein
MLDMTFLTLAAASEDMAFLFASQAVVRAQEAVLVLVDQSGYENFDEVQMPSVLFS